MGKHQPEDPLNNFKRTLDEVNATAKAIQALDPFRELRETLRMLHSYDPFREIREAVRQFKEADPFAEIRRTLDVLRDLDPLKDVREHLKKFQSIDPFRDVRGFLEDLRRNQELFRESMRHIPSETSLEESLRALVSKYAEIEPEGLTSEDILSNVICKVGEDAKNAPKTLLSLEFFLNLLITIVVVIYSQNMSDRTEAKLLAEIRSLREILATYAVSNGEVDHADTFYVVERTVRTRTKPNTTSPQGKALYPNQKVRLVERKGKWVRVEYYNHIVGLHENGWCLKKYLVICN